MGQGIELAHGLVVVGIGLCVIGGGMGIGWVGSKALEALARQPEEYKNIRTLMIMAAALVEGLAFFAVIIGLIVALK